MYSYQLRTSRSRHLFEAWGKFKLGLQKIQGMLWGSFWRLVGPQKPTLQGVPHKPWVDGRVGKQTSNLKHEEVVTPKWHRWGFSKG